jgi:hypothetical protein
MCGIEDGTLIRQKSKPSQKADRMPTAPGGRIRTAGIQNRGDAKGPAGAKPMPTKDHVTIWHQGQHETQPAHR